MTHHDPVPVLVPQTNPNDDTAVLVRWEVEPGSRIAADEPIATLETTKAAFEVVAPAAGYLQSDLQPGELVAVGAPLAWITETADAPVLQQRPGEPASDAESAAPRVHSDGSPIPAGAITRKALKLMRSHGLTANDLGAVRDPASPIRAADVERAARERRTESHTAPRHAERPRASASSEIPSDAEPLDQSPAKILEVKLLGEVYATAIPSTVTTTLSVERVAAHLSALAAETGPLSLLEIAIHATARVLPSFPALNGFYKDGRAWKHRAISIGFAVNLGRSLRVPVIRDADRLTPLEIARRVRDLSLRYAREELTVDDLGGGTFTVTDLSAFGIVQFVPVLNYRQAAILGVCAERPGSSTRDLVLTFDHRLADGMQAARFLAGLREHLEGPLRT